MTQTVFLEVYRRLKQFDPARGTFKVWLLQFAYSRSMHRRNYLFVRKFHNQVEVSAVDLASVFQHIVSDRAARRYCIPVQCSRADSCARG
jgi:DNA-directed RNA polymerase specialized sigma24 family protein